VDPQGGAGQYYPAPLDPWIHHIFSQMFIASSNLLAKFVAQEISPTFPPTSDLVSAAKFALKQVPSAVKSSYPLSYKAASVILKKAAPIALSYLTKKPAKQASVKKVSVKKPKNATEEMPSYTTKRRSYPKRQTYASARRSGKKTYSAARYSVPLSKKARVEVKHNDSFGPPIDYAEDLHSDGSGLFTELGVVAQGDATHSERQGNVIRSLGIDIGVKLIVRAIDPNPASGAVCGACRVIVFRWDQGYVSPSPTAIFAEDTGTSANNIIKPYNIDNAKNYKVLYDQIHYVTPVAFSTVDAAVPEFNPGNAEKFFTISLKDSKEITFQTTSGDSGDSRYFMAFFAADSYASRPLFGAYTFNYKFIDV